jgi:hypothetical protein
MPSFVLKRVATAAAQCQSKPTKRRDTLHEPHDYSARKHLRHPSRAVTATIIAVTEPKGGPE